MPRVGKALISTCQMILNDDHLTRLQNVVEFPRLSLKFWHDIAASCRSSSAIAERPRCRMGQISWRLYFASHFVGARKLKKLFSLGVTSETLTSEYLFEVGVFQGVGQFGPKFQVEVDIPTNHLCTDREASECLTTLPLTVFTQRNFVADFLRKKSTFIQQTATLRFASPPWGLTGNLRCSS